MMSSVGPRRHNSYDSILPTDCYSKDRHLQFDSGKHSLTSSDTFSSTVENLIDFDHVVAQPSAMAGLDPLLQPITPSFVQQHVAPTSHDSLFSDTISPVSVGAIRGFSPPPVLHTHYRHSGVNISPRSSTADVCPPTCVHSGSSTFTGISRPRPRPNSSQDSTSAPTSRPDTPKLYPQSSNISPSGSVHSLPQYPTTTSSDVNYFASDSSATSIDFDDTLFDTDNIINFHNYHS